MWAFVAIENLLRSIGRREVRRTGFRMHTSTVYGLFLEVRHHSNVFCRMEPKTGETVAWRRVGYIAGSVRPGVRRRHSGKRRGQNLLLARVLL